MTAAVCSIMVAGALVGGAVGLDAAGASPQSPLVIGLLLPPDEADAMSLRQGVLMGIDRANTAQAGRVSVLIRGRSGVWGSDAAEAARLVSEDAACGLIAPSSGTATHLVLQVAGRTAVPVVSLCPEASVIRTGVPWAIRIVPSAIDEARALFSGLEAKQAGHIVHWAAVVPAERAGRQAARDLTSAAAAAGCQLEKPIQCGRDGDEVAGLCERLLNLHPDGVLLWLDSYPAARLVRALRAAGFTGCLAGPGVLRSAGFVARAGKAGEGFVVPAVMAGPGAEDSWRAFAADFRQRFGRQPDPTAAMACDAATLLVHLLLNSGSRPARLAFPLRDVVQGVTGPLRFDRDGNRLVSFRLMQLHAGGFAECGSAIANGISEDHVSEASPTVGSTSG